LNLIEILITGATGFVGSWLTRYFLEKENKIIIHGSSKFSIEKLKNQMINYKRQDKIELWEQDFLKKDWKFPDFSKIDVIIHCAAATKVREGIIENFEKYFALNVLATKILAKKALEARINHFIYLSSGQVFGIPPSFPISETTPKKPINLYGYTKLIGELVVASLGALGLNYTIVRPFSVYGKGHDNIISIITNKVLNNEEIMIYGDGTSKRAFSHVLDFCRAIELIMNNEMCFNEDYNLSGTREYSVNDLIQSISRKFQKTPKIIYAESSVNELKRNIADLSKIKALGFNSQISLEDFIEEEL